MVSLDLTGPVTVHSGTMAPLTVDVANTGSGHNFPTGFPEGRVGWLAVRAFDLESGKELQIHDSFWNRTSVGVGRLTTQEMIDPNFPEKCRWSIPAGSIDPYALQFKAVASRGDGCPTLDLVYAAPLNLVTSRQGLPIDGSGRVVDASNPGALEQFRDMNGDGERYRLVRTVASGGMAQVMEAVASGTAASNAGWRSSACCRSTRATASAAACSSRRRASEAGCITAASCRSWITA